MIDLKYTDLVGWQRHVTVSVDMLQEGFLEKGIGVDGSSISGITRVEASDLAIVPDLSTAVLDPFWEEPVLSLLCDLVDPDSGESYKLDPRGVAKRAEKYLQDSGIADRSLWLPELEFYILASRESKNLAEYHGGPGKLDPQQLAVAGGYHASQPLDKTENLRNRMCRLMTEAGIPVKYHHRENGIYGQAEIEMNFAPLLKACDGVVLSKYIIRNVAAEGGKAATFMPKPFFMEAGNGLHLHFKLFRGEEPLFYDKEGYAGLSKLALQAIAGMLKHSPALMAFACPSTNSYRRLVPGFEAPVYLAFSAANRTAAIRIPAYARLPEDKCFEYRLSDGSCNIYLAVASLLMAALDGIERGLDPREEGFGPFDGVDIFELPEEERAKIPVVPRSLEESLAALEEDHDFLLKDNVFSEELIKGWVEYKRKNECYQVNARPHPYELELYFDL
ncbi:MAG: type I glutamate--ammonia ligase [Firmicutes bacterium]|nr:type I glutamate--ammonia ligase [Bacillota bacterium]